MTVQIDNLMCLLDMWRMDKVPIVQIREQCGVMKGVD